MLGFFKDKTMEIDHHGTFTYQKKYWHSKQGNLLLLNDVPIKIDGNKSGPFNRSMVMLSQFETNQKLFGEKLANHLFYQHYFILSEAVASGIAKIDEFPLIESEQNIWEFANIKEILIEKDQPIKILVDPKWDDEHFISIHFDQQGISLFEPVARNTL